MTSTSLLLEKEHNFFQALHSVTSGSRKPKILSASSPDQMKHCYNLQHLLQLNDLPFPVSTLPVRAFSTDEEWALQHSSVFPGLSVSESWYFGSQHGSTRGVQLTTVIVPRWSRLPQPWDWTMKYLKMPGLKEGGLWQCNVKCETIEHL